jgi:integrase
VAYAEFRDAVRPCRESGAFLVTERGSRLRGCTTRLTFATLGQAIGLRPGRQAGRRRRGPRLQDFRHTFATRRLIEWYRAGLDVDRLMPRLATYLGHVRVAETYWYIQAVPELLRLATERLERSAQGDVQ